jgi:putative transposase
VNAGQQSVVSLAEIVNAYGYSRQSYYQRLQRDGQRRGEESVILEAVQRARAQLPQTGARKLQHHLKREGIEVGRDRLLRVLKAHGMLIAPKKSYRKTTDSTHGFKVYGNLVKDKTLTGPQQVIVSDITYIHTLEGFCYLSLLMDLYSRKVVGYHLSRSLSVEGSLQALRMAVRGLPKGVIHHSDRGVQYCCKAYTKLLKKRRMQISMTEKDHVYENANAERLNGILKHELMLGGTLPSVAVAKKLVKSSIDLYNNQRLHTALNYRTPSEAHAA